MANRIPQHLRLHVQQPDEQFADEHRFFGFDRLCSAFHAATGWHLRCSTSEDSGQRTFPWLEPEHLSRVNVAIARSASSVEKLATERTQASDLATALGDVLSEVRHVRAALREREAELAACVPVVSVREDAKHLANSLESVLRATVDTLDCQAAGLYMLDESTSCLKLRAHWGLSEQSHLAAPRLLAEAVADVEALSGHAVVIEETQLVPHWNVPEPYNSAVCVPISSPTTILGTLWVFCDQARDFTAREQNLIEIMAGRLAADLDRAVLLRELAGIRRHRRDRDEMASWHRDRGTPPSPPVDGWDLSGVCTANDGAADFFHWHLCDDDQLALTVASVGGSSINESLDSVSLQATLRAHLQYPHRCCELVNLVNQSLWSGSAGDQHASMFHTSIDPTCGAVAYAGAGPVNAFILRPHGWEPLQRNSQRLGTDDATRYSQFRQIMVPGDILVAFSDLTGTCGAESDARANQIAELLLRNTHLSARAMADMAAGELRSCGDGCPSRNLAVLVARRHETHETGSA